MKTVIAGGSGHVGQNIQSYFAKHEIINLTRSPQFSHDRRWDGTNLGSWAGELDSADVLINLTGRSVDCRYNEITRREIFESRVNSVRILAEAIASRRTPPKAWLQMSTATIYDPPNDENTGLIGQWVIPSSDAWKFTIEVAKAWESALDHADVPSTRKVCLRSAMVMGPVRGSVFDVLVGLAKRGLLGMLGSDGSMSLGSMDKISAEASNF